MVALMVYDAHDDLWLHGLGGILEVSPTRIILGFVPVSNGDLQITNFAFGGRLDPCRHDERDWLPACSERTAPA